MTEDKFWEIIDRTKSKTQEGQIAALAAVLDAQSPENILAFQTVYYALLDKAHRWDLWGAAYVINGGCSDDGFDYFCDWLVSRGRTVYEAAIADPESLADTDTDDIQFESFRYVADDVYESKVGHEMDVRMSSRGEPLGEPFDERTVDQLFPRLAGENVSLDFEPQSAQENVKAVDAVFAELIGKRLTSIAPILTAGPFKKNAGMAFYFALGRPRLEAKAWTIECADGESLSTLELVEAEVCEAKEPTEEASIFEGKARVARATQELFANIKTIRMTVETVQRIGQGDLRITIANAPFCEAIILHSCAGIDASLETGVLLKQDDDYYNLKA